MCFETTVVTRCKTCDNIIKTMVFVDECPGSTGLVSYKLCRLALFGINQEKKEECESCRRIRKEEERKKRLAILLDDK